MLSKVKGDLAVAHSILALTEKGYEILLPIGDKQKYDIVADVGRGSLLRIQVKYAGLNARGKHVASLRVTGGNKCSYSTKRYREGDFDSLFVYSQDGRYFLIPWLAIAEKAGICLDSPVYEEYLI